VGASSETSPFILESTISSAMGGALGSGTSFGFPPIYLANDVKNGFYGRFIFHNERDLATPKLSFCKRLVPEQWPTEAA
jgi:hypothetical protein